MNGRWMKIIRFWFLVFTLKFGFQNRRRILNLQRWLIFILLLDLNLPYLCLIHEHLLCFWQKKWKKSFSFCHQLSFSVLVRTNQTGFSLAFLITFDGILWPIHIFLIFYSSILKWLSLNHLLNLIVLLKDISLE